MKHISFYVDQVMERINGGEMKELYKKATSFEPVQSCPVCGGDAQVYTYIGDSKNGSVQKLVACTTGGSFGPQDEDTIHPGCLLFMPPIDFYHATIREAVKYWNEYARHLSAIRRKRYWDRHKATTIRSLREATSLKTLDTN